MYIPTLNMYLATKIPHKYTNAVCIKVNKDSYHVLSDFGNIMEFTLVEINRIYEPILSWVEMNSLGFINQTLEERIEHQIELLTKAKQTISNL